MLSSILISACLLSAATIDVAKALQCYTGFSTIGGQDVGTTTEECSHSTDSCYKANADASILSLVKMAGCSTLRCYFNKNECMEQELMGAKVTFCCCDDKDLCNGSSKTKAALSALAGLFLFVLHLLAKYFDIAAV